MSVELAKAYVTIIPAFEKGTQSAIARELTSGTSSVGTTIGNNVAGGITSAVSAASVAVGNVLANVVSTAVNTVTASLSDAVSRYDTLRNFPKVMENIGVSTEDAEAASAKLSEALKGLPTTLNDATSSVTRFTTKNKDVDKSTDYFIALNNAVIAGGTSMSTQQTAIEQLSQSYAKGKMDMVEWRSIMTAMPTALDQVSQAMGITTDELGEGLRNGTIAMDDFMDTLVQVNESGVNGMASLEEQAKSMVGGIATGITNAGTAVVRGLANMMDTIDQIAQDNGLPTISEMFTNLASSIDSAFTWIQTKMAAVDIPQLLADMQPSIQMVKDAFDWLGRAINTVTDFLIEHQTAVAVLVQALGGLLIANKIATVIRSAATAIGLMAASSVAAAPATTAMTTSLSALTANAVGMVALGAAVALVATGIALLAQSAIALTEAGWPAVAVLGGLIAVVAGLAVGAAALGTALTAGAAGFIAFGASFALVSAGLTAVTLAVSVLVNAFANLVDSLGGFCTNLQTIATYGGAAALALTQLGVAGIALVAAAASMAVAAGTMAILTATLAAISAAAVTATAALVALTAGTAAMSSGFMAMGTSVTATSNLMGNSIVNNATKSTEALVALTAAVVAMTASFAGASAAIIASMVAMRAGIKTSAKNAENDVSDMVKAIVKTADDAQKDMVKAGENISKGLARGIRNALPDVTAAANALVEEADRAVRAKARIASPSKLFRDLGEYIPQGFAEGIRNDTYMVADAASGMVAGSVAGYADGISSASGSGGVTYNFGDINLTADDIAGINTIQQFVTMLQRAKRAYA